MENGRQFQREIWRILVENQEQDWEVCESRLPNERQTLVGDGNFLCL